MNSTPVGVATAAHEFVVPRSIPSAMATALKRIANRRGFPDFRKLLEACCDFWLGCRRLVEVAGSDGAPKLRVEVHTQLCAAQLQKLQDAFASSAGRSTRREFARAGPCGHNFGMHRMLGLLALA